MDFRRKTTLGTTILKDSEVPKPELDPKTKKEKYTDTQIPIPKKRSKIYRISAWCLGITGLVWILSLIFMLFNHFSVISIILSVIADIFTLPLFFGGLGMLVIRLYLDRKKISTAVIVNVAKNYIMADIFVENRRVIEVACMLLDDGKKFMYEGGTYTVDIECVWMDNTNRPHSFYIQGLPNPIKFGFEGDIKKYLENLLAESKNIDLEEPGQYLSINLAYSSTNLTKLMQDKILKELHDPSGNAEKMAIAMLIVGIVVGAGLAILMALLFKGGGSSAPVHMVIDNINQTLPTAQRVIVG